MVEGDTDRYFFRAVIQERHRNLDQEIAVLHIGGKGEFPKWKSLFSSFGLSVSSIADFDFLIDLFYPSEKGTSLKTEQAVLEFKQRHSDWETKIDSEYINQNYVLKEGDLETYLGIRKDLDEIIRFCNEHLLTFLGDNSSTKSNEVRTIIENITS